jgi:hypothetical protein
MNFIFNDNVCILCLFCNIKKSTATAKTIAGNIYYVSYHFKNNCTRMTQKYVYMFLIIFFIDA